MLEKEMSFEGKLKACPRFSFGEKTKTKDSKENVKPKFPPLGEYKLFLTHKRAHPIMCRVMKGGGMTSVGSHVKIFSQKHFLQLVLKCKDLGFCTCGHKVLKTFYQIILKTKQTVLFLYMNKSI
jgi:hypothetical protein